MNHNSQHVFSYKNTKNKVIIFHNNNQILIIKGLKSKTLKSKLSNSSESEIQLILAKITGNFKRGNEKQ